MSGQLDFLRHFGTQGKLVALCLALSLASLSAVSCLSYQTGQAILLVSLPPVTVLMV